MASVRHLAYLTLFALLTLAFTWPLATILTTGVIGTPGDNLSFVWNFWWAKTALATHQSVFWTPALFAPLGTSLATHSYVPLMSVGAALVFPRVSPVALYNASLLLAVFLNFTCAYFAAVTITKDRLASVVGAVVFGGAPFLAVRLAGHLSVLSAWGLPLLLAVTLRYCDRPTLTRAFCLPLVLAALAYTDYYYFIFGLVMATMVLALAYVRVAVAARARTPRRRRWAAGLAIVLLTIIVAAAWIEATGGADTSLAGIRIRMTDTFNARVIAGFLAIVIALVWTFPSVRVTRRETGHQWFLHASAATATLALLLAPLLIASVSVWRAGDYSTQAYVWRNAPPGIDLASLLMGSQLHPVTGSWTLAGFRHFGVNGVEGAAWLGIVPMLLVAAAWRMRSRAGVATGFWIGGFFLVWSLGPYLRILNFNTGLMLPQTLLRFIPIAANARIPGRAFAVVQLMAAMLGAVALASLRDTLPKRAGVLTLLALAGVVVDYYPAARMTTHLDAPSIYTTLRDLPAGTVLEVPLGIRDGFGARGALDHRVLFYQTIHEHPQMGGFVARLSHRTQTEFESDPIAGPLLDLSEGRAPGPMTPAACHSSVVCDARYLVFDDTAAPPPLKAFVDATFALRPIASDRGRTLSAIERVRSCGCP